MKNEKTIQASQRGSMLCLGALAAVVACSSPKQATTQQPAPPPTAVAPAQEPAAPAAPVTPAAAPVGMQWTAQPGWVAESTTSAMRKAQFKLPRAEGDGEDASLIVYYFGGSGGSREANLERWAGQFEQADGGDSMIEMQQSTRTVAGMEVVDTDLSGTYIAETSPGSGERVNKEGWRMLASIVEHADGPWYVKLVGPQQTVAKWQASYTAFVGSMRP